jgi:haloalkane dehalogenase
MSTGDRDDRAHASKLTTLTRRRALGVVLTAPAAGMVGLPSAQARDARQTASSGGVRVLRTPEARFRALADYPFAPHYVHVDAHDGSRTRLRVHYLDERPSDWRSASGETILLLHGEPSWSYLYRHVIPPLVAAGHRCVAVDLVGFGKSDKLADRHAYTYQRHVDCLREAVFDRLNLRDVTMVCHDWGGMLGLRLLTDHPQRFRRVVASNTGLDTGEQVPDEAWKGLAQWLQFSQRTYPLEPAHVVDEFSLTNLDPAVRAAYNAPFPDESYLQGVRQFPLLIPISPEDENTPALKEAWSVLRTLQTPFLCVFSDDDHVTDGEHSALSDHIPGAQGQPHTAIKNAAHFVQEDQPAEFAAAVDSLIRSTR